MNGSFFFFFRLFVHHTRPDPGSLSTPVKTFKPLNPLPPSHPSLLVSNESPPSYGTLSRLLCDYLSSPVPPPSCALSFLSFHHVYISIGPDSAVDSVVSCPVFWALGRGLWFHRYFQALSAYKSKAFKLSRGRNTDEPLCVVLPLSDPVPLPLSQHSIQLQPSPRYFQTTTIDGEHAMV